MRPAVFDNQSGQLVQGASVTRREGKQIFRLWSQPLDGDEIGERASLPDTIGNGPSNQSDVIIKPVDLTVMSRFCHTQFCTRSLPALGFMACFDDGGGGADDLGESGSTHCAEDSAG